MTNLDLDKVFELLMQLWPNWEVTPAERAAWSRAVRPFDYDCVKDSVLDFFSEQSRNYSRPVPLPVVEKAQVYQRQRFGSRIETNEPQLAYTIECIEHNNPKMIGSKHKFYNTREIRPDNYDRCLGVAEGMCERVQRAYEGTWVIIRDWEQAKEPVPF